MPGTMIGRGNFAYQFSIAMTLTPVSVANGVTAEQSFTVPGLQTNDQVSSLTFSGAYTVNVDIVNTRVSAANTLTVAFQNNSGGALTPPAGVWLLEINRLEVSRYADLPASAI